MSVPLPNLGLLGDFQICDKDIVQGLNQNFELIDTLLQLSIVDIVGVLPVSAAEGERYILTTDNSINQWDGAAWVSTQAQYGFMAYVQSQNALYAYNNTDWVNLASINITYDNTTSLLVATNVQGAIDELKSIIDGATTPFVNQRLDWNEFEDDSFSKPIKILEQRREVYQYDFGSKSSQALVASFTVPGTYISGPLALEIVFYSKQSSVDAQFNTQSDLYRATYNTILQTENFEGPVQTLTANNLYRQVVRITDATGNINGTPISVGDVIDVFLFNNGSLNTTTQDIFLLAHSTGVNNI